jgi:hypothetical protein
MRREHVCFGENQWVVLLNEKRLHRVGSWKDTVIAAIGLLIALIIYR